MCGPHQRKKLTLRGINSSKSPHDSLRGLITFVKEILPLIHVYWKRIFIAKWNWMWQRASMSAFVVMLWVVTTFSFVSVHACCHVRFMHPFTTIDSVLEVLTLICSNQCKYYENAKHCRKFTCKPHVATRLSCSIFVFVSGLSVFYTKVEWKKVESSLKFTLM